MQLIGLVVLVAVVSFGFAPRDMAGTVSAFDLHAFVVVIGGSAGAILTASSTRNSLWTLLCLRELLPGVGSLAKHTRRMEDERTRFAELWRDGKRAQAVELAERSQYAELRGMLKLVLARASHERTQTVFLELRHAALGFWQPPIANWEL
ncbi:MAG: hypothetical protein KC613_19555, partial [Myxococcales bacterium]|nr:hypothetical protein [Myxococcales bacterium]